MKQCKICGATENETRIIKDLCRKHYLQIYRHGKIQRSIYDKNEITTVDDISVMKLYDAKGNVIGETKFNSIHLPKISNIKWYLKQGYVRGTVPNTQTKVFLHRIILGATEGTYVDHINGDTLNNLDSNLRLCSLKENSRNRKYITTKEHVGVAKTPSNKWKATISVDYKSIHLGTFDSFEEAKNARLKAEVKYFKEFAPTKTSQ